MSKQTWCARCGCDGCQEIQRSQAAASDRNRLRETTGDERRRRNAAIWMLATSGVRYRDIAAAFALNINTVGKAARDYEYEMEIRIRRFSGVDCKTALSRRLAAFLPTMPATRGYGGESIGGIEIPDPDYRGEPNPSPPPSPSPKVDE